MLGRAFPSWHAPTTAVPWVPPHPRSDAHGRAVAVGKDAVPRASVANLVRLMDEMVTSLARCKQPKLTVRACVAACGREHPRACV